MTSGCRVESGLERPRVEDQGRGNGSSPGRQRWRAAVPPSGFPGGWTTDQTARHHLVPSPLTVEEPEAQVISSAMTEAQVS